MSLVKHFAKRLTILYFFWCVVWSPIIYIQKDYFHPVSIMTPLYVIREFFFGELFDASWFLGALLVGIPTIALLMRKLNEYVVLVGIAILYLFMCHVLSCHFFSEIQEWYKCSIASGGMKFSFPEGLLWITTGYVMANKKVIVWMNSVKNELAWGATLLFFVLMFFIPVVPKILCVAALLVAAYTWQLPEHPQLYRRFRTYSILFYVIHGCFKKIPKQLFGWENGPVLFVVTIAFCFLASEFIMRMKDVKGFGWLRYAY